MAGQASSSTTAGGAEPRPRAGVPVWRVGKPDALLAGAVGAARAALLEAVDAEHIGRHLGAKSEGERLVTHLFECLRPGYRGWQWYVTVARVSRSKIVTVSELGVLPSEDSVLAPEWVPWSERVRPEEREQAILDAAAEGVEAADEADEYDDEAADESADDSSDEGPDEAEEAEAEEAEAEEAIEAADAEAAGITDIDDEID
ncbi:DUF3027 domain-containing protein [Sinomonas terrae]|uniref:DUF3027 domain-containing protein n=1 Tax=Sinomonas terrae TaxID=2908838 RepID=A0ABS9U418_9MICC|nr:DUF3027 domain-containing protein [Sinomonas terrae]MCH6471442.1 DUF3027 domain-containing protein [Sinomonas terrae]